MSTDLAARTRTADVALVTVASVIVAAVVARPLIHDLVGRPAVANFATIFVAIVLQSVPFLALGVTVSAAIGTFVPPGLLPRLLPKRPAAAVPVGALAGVALPGCECGSVPIARRLVDRGAPAAAALAFLLSAPAINPVVLVATAVAFPGQPEMVLGRFLASLLAAATVGWVWVRMGRDDLLLARKDPHVHADSRALAFVQIAQHDFLNAGGFLIIGAAIAAAFQTVIPREVLTTVSGNGVLAVLALAVLAVLMAICSEADAFIAASLKQFSPTAQLAFMTVGPMVDVKLIALQVGTFGRGFAARFAPLTFVVATASAGLIGWLLL
jgi:uncharacterized membrane protein YraQ (UPF0718 family)